MSSINNLTIGRYLCSVLWTKGFDDEPRLWRICKILSDHTINVDDKFEVLEILTDVENYAENDMRVEKVLIW